MYVSAIILTPMICYRIVMHHWLHTPPTHYPSNPLGIEWPTTQRPPEDDVLMLRESSHSPNIWNMNYESLDACVYPLSLSHIYILWSIYQILKLYLGMLHQLSKMAVVKVNPMGSLLTWLWLRSEPTPEPMGPPPKCLGGRGDLMRFFLARRKNVRKKHMPRCNTVYI